MLSSSGSMIAMWHYHSCLRDRALDVDKRSDRPDPWNGFDKDRIWMLVRLVNWYCDQQPLDLVCQ